MKYCQLRFIDHIQEEKLDKPESLQVVAALSERLKSPEEAAELIIYLTSELIDHFDSLEDINILARGLTEASNQMQAKTIAKTVRQNLRVLELVRGQLAN
jgi:hypothetical protein